MGFRSGPLLPPPPGPLLIKVPHSWPNFGGGGCSSEGFVGRKGFEDDKLGQIVYKDKGFGL